ncbi:MAG: DDE-type integrase/transposase/recombinase [Pseudonocardiaceae bacterium]
MDTDRDTLVALARWQVIAVAADERLTPSQRGLMLSELATQVHRDVDGRPRRYTVRTLYRWLAAWRERGFDGLKPARRRDAGTHRTASEVLGVAAALRREEPARSAAQVAEVLARTRAATVGPRTLQRFFAANGLDRARLEGRHRAYGRFEAAACGDLWIADAWDGPALAELGGKHAQLFSLLDDHSRLMPGAAFYPDVGEHSFQRCLRKAIARRGIPRVLYIDNGAAFASGQLKLICARLGIRITHSRPYRPQGRGKKERAYRTIAEQFAVEAAVADITTLEQLNRYFLAWVEQVYHHRIHRGTGQPPLQRWLAGPSAIRPAPDPAALADAFWWTQTRVVTRTATVSLHGNLYQVDPVLVGRRVQLRYDPEDLTVVQVWHHDQPAGTAAGAELRTHADPKLRATNHAEPGPPTGIAYLDALVADHAAALADGAGALSYYQPPDQQPPDQPATPGPGHDRRVGPSR